MANSLKLLLIAAMLTVSTAACTGLSDQIAPEDGSGITLTGEPTYDPQLALTLQSEVLATAQALGPVASTLTPSPEIAPTAEVPEGESLRARTGNCLVPDGFELQEREGFCLAVPRLWTIVNVDGGLAANLQTTPGQAISLRPEWAESADICSIMIFIAAERDPMAHLRSRHDALSEKDDMESITVLQNQQLAGMILPGFTWRQNDGKGGAIYADLASLNRLAHISFSGYQCPLENLLPVFETLRFNIQR